MDYVWKIKLLNFWVVVPEIIANIAFRTNFIRICDVTHFIGRNLEEFTINNKQYVRWEKEVLEYTKPYCL
jgi:3-polyprenyl-4-hydroxybenzoate decarboxylase